MAKAMYDPWSKIVTKNGYAGDEVISALQKSIRRAKEEDACMFAYDMFISSPQLLEIMWSSLLTISVEDIGFGNLQAAVQVNTLNEVRKSYAYDDGDQPMYFIHAIRLLCASTKDRSSDYLKNIIDEKNIIEFVNKLCDEGLSKKDAIKKVSKNLGLEKN